MIFFVLSWWIIKDLRCIKQVNSTKYLSNIWCQLKTIKTLWVCCHKRDILSIAIDSCHALLHPCLSLPLLWYPCLVFNISLVSNTIICYPKTATRIISLSETKINPILNIFSNFSMILLNHRYSLLFISGHGDYYLLDCSQPSLFFRGILETRYASMELPPSYFVKASAIWGECLNYRGEGEWGRGSEKIGWRAAPSKRT